MNKKLSRSMAVLATATTLTGCANTTITFTAEQDTLEYAKETVDALGLLTLEKTDDVTAEPSEIDTSTVGDQTVTYSYKKTSAEITYTVQDTKVPVVTISDKDLSVKTKDKVSSNVTVEDEVDGELELVTKQPTALVEDTSKIGKETFYEEGWYMVDTSKVDTTKAGEYTVTITACDNHGNTVKVNYVVTVSDDGSKKNDEATLQVTTLEEQDFTVTTTLSKVSSQLEEINSAGVETYVEEHAEEVTSSNIETSSTKETTTTKKEASNSKNEANASKKETSSSNKSEANATSNKETSDSSKSGSSSVNKGTSTSTTTNTTTSNNNANTSNKNEANASKNEANASHTHSWVEQTQTVHHDAVTQQVYVVDQEAYDEPVYTWYDISICKHCGAEFFTGLECAEHCALGSCNNGYGTTYYTKSYQEQTGTTHHDEVGHYETQTVQAAYDETVVTGYVCSTCGATK